MECHFIFSCCQDYNGTLKPMIYKELWLTVVYPSNCGQRQCSHTKYDGFVNTMMNDSWFPRGQCVILFLALFPALANSITISQLFFYMSLVYLSNSWSMLIFFAYKPRFLFSTLSTCDILIFVFYIPNHILPNFLRCRRKTHDQCSLHALHQGGSDFSWTHSHYHVALTYTFL